MYKKDAPKQVIIIRKDLNMRKGKMIAQGAHASMKVIFDMMEKRFITGGGGGHSWGKYMLTLDFDENDYIEDWINGIFKKIVVGAESLDELTTAYEEAKKQGILCSIIEDAGLTEFGGNVTITAAAIGPDDPKKIDKITSHLKLL
jgi:peptidyl-tRNA hydrolase, PTH2 family